MLTDRASHHRAGSDDCHTLVIDVDETSQWSGDSSDSRPAER